VALFHRKPESPAEIAAEQKLDAVTREVAWKEFGKEADREFNPVLALPVGGARRRFVSLTPGRFIAGFGRFRRFRKIPGDPVPEPFGDPDPAGPGGLRDALEQPSSEP